MRYSRRAPGFWTRWGHPLEAARPQDTPVGHTRNRFQEFGQRLTLSIGEADPCIAQIDMCATIASSPRAALATF